MIKRAKLTLDQQAVAPEIAADADQGTNAEEESKPSKTGSAQKKQTKKPWREMKKPWKTVLVAGVTLASLVVFKQKIF